MRPREPEQTWEENEPQRRRQSKETRPMHTDWESLWANKFGETQERENLEEKDGWVVWETKNSDENN